MTGSQPTLYITVKRWYDNLNDNDGEGQMLKVTELTKHPRVHDYPGYYVPPTKGNGFKGYWQSVRRGSRDARSGKSVIYVSIEAETWWENVGDRVSRPYKEWMQPIRDEFKHRFFGANAVDLKGMHWYAKAGCSMCPCSPGFILPNHRGVDFWVTLDTDVRTTDPELSAARIAQLAADPTIPGISLVDA